MGFTQHFSPTSREVSEIDIENIVEELECIERKDKREIINHLALLLALLLKWQYQPERSW